MKTSLCFLLALLTFVSVNVVVSEIAATDPIVVAKKISVQFYGEAACPFCRKFVEESWKEIWDDDELKGHIDFTFVPWGNAYFATEMCGKGPYNPSERACFYEKCITAETDDDKACFGGDPIYQHGKKEGQVDIYESCILEDNGLDAAFAFTICVEGSDMDDDAMSAHEVMIECVPEGVDPTEVEECLNDRGRKLEIANAKRTPVHAGVPYVVVDSKPMDNPFDTKATVCKLLDQQGVRPSGCSSVDDAVSRLRSRVSNS